MARLSDAILNPNGVGKAYAKGRTAPMVNLKNGGQFGWMPDMPAYVSNAQYVRRNLIARVIEAPRGFQDLPDPNYWYETFKALIELHPRTIEGLAAGLTAEFVEQPFGGANEMQEDISNVTRQRSTPSFGYIEKYGRAINAFYAGWIQWLMMDPNTKAPLVTTLGKKPSDLLPDYTGATILFLEPDPTQTKVDKAWLVTNMMPKSDGPVEGRRDLTSAGNNVEFNVEFTGIAQWGNGVSQFAQTILDQMNLTGANPNQRPAFVNKIMAAVQDSAAGYAEGIAAAARTAVQQ